MLNLVPSEHWCYGTTDLIQALSSALSRHSEGREVKIPIPGVGACVPVRSARAAIVIALKALALPPGALVGVPLYCCPVVFDAISAAGLRPRFIDVDFSTYCLSVSDLAAKGSETNAVVAVHMFGNVCNMPALRAAAPGVPFIEDCAQALGSRFDGRLVGSFGELGVFSFRSGKYVSAGEGGAIYCGAPELERRVEELVAALPAPGRAAECVHVATTYLRSLLRSKPLWGLIGSRLWHAYSRKCMSNCAIVLEKMYQTDRSIAAVRLPLAASAIDRQRRIADYYSKSLFIDNDMRCSEPIGAFFNRLQYPLLLRTEEECAQVALRLQSDGISTSRPYKDVVDVATTRYGYPRGDCPNAERITRRVLVIPCNDALTSEEIERIARSVNRAQAERADRRNGTAGKSISKRTAKTRQVPGHGSEALPASCMVTHETSHSKF